MRSGIFFSIVLVAIFLVIVLQGDCTATEEFARRTGKGCSFCHARPNGGPLNPVGVAYIRNGYRYPIPERILEKSHRLSTPLHLTLRSILGYLHIAVASIFIGTIFYVHIFIRPSRITGGIPRGERILGLSSMATLAATGLYLTWYRMDSFASFTESHFGVLLTVKLILFALMVTLGILAVTVVNRKMRSGIGSAGSGEGGEPVTRDTLARFDGKGGRPAYILYGDMVYDVTASDKWTGGGHFRKHAAGRDLTADLGGAPHGAEVLDRIPVVAHAGGAGGSRAGLSPVRKLFVAMAYVNLVIVFLILACVAWWKWGVPVVPPPSAFGGTLAAASCEGCHRTERPGIYHDWERSIHAKVGVGCRDCHQAPDSAAQMVSVAHFEQSPVPVTPLVTPARCARCHADEAAQYGGSKHAHTVEIINAIDKWMRDGMNSRIERATGCYACHGSVVAFIGGHPVDETWPNVGVGRVNPDGSLGSCTSCHTRHRFSLVEARKPEACDQCHLGPDHPQIEIYNESKHGTIYHAEGDSWQWRTDDMRWLAGRDYRAPTCAACHISEAPGVERSHDVTGRLAWELQAPLTIRPSAFSPFPAGTDWKEERSRMFAVCSQCHSDPWVHGHFANLDSVVEHYNGTYYLPCRSVLDDLYRDEVLSRVDYFDEHLEWEFYELWHHEGRRARMGAAMMAPDYAWWHGFYELKHRYVTFMEEAAALRREGRQKRYREFPGRLE
jgi:predicted heme/steroid binding protein